VDHVPAGCAAHGANSWRQTYPASWQRLPGVEFEIAGGLCDYGFGPYRLFRRANCFRTRVMMLCKTLTPLDQELIERRINDFVPNRIYDIHTHLLTPGKELPPHLCQE